MFRKFSKHQIFVNSSEQCDVAHYLPYFEKATNNAHPCTVFSSHQEQRKDLFDKFISCSKTADVAITMSKKYTDILTCAGANVVQAIPGVDSGKFALRQAERPTSKNKLIVGYVGRQYASSDRKNPRLLERIAAQQSFVDLRISGGIVKEQDLPKFYASLDAVVSPSKIEGGPMSIVEGLAVGVPIICFESVGLADEFNEGIIKVKFGDADAFMARLERFWATKEYMEYRKYDTMLSMRKQVENLTWENFVKKHDEIWSSLKNAKV
ncbi:MAG: glycosyltransferase [Patescibacteria group bacterium]